jgi:peptidoglycan DL-endopeptidase CwlO
MPVKGGYLILAGGGALLAWSGIRGKQWSEAFRQLIKGNVSATLTAYPIIGNPNSTDSTGAIQTTSSFSGSGSALANALASYAGKTPYKWGGANPNGWDCSGAVNYTGNVVVGIAIPGYAPHTFTGNSHGPTTLVWLAWLPAHATRVSRAGVAAGDIVIGPAHMGVAVSNSEYVSALDTQYGTTIRPIASGWAPAGATYWRLN